MEEIWKKITGFEDEYIISNTGKIKSCKRDIICKNGAIYHKKEMDLIISDNGLGYKKAGPGYIHRLVALEFVYNNDPINKTQVNHINGDKSNNNAYNLEWVTPKQNMNHAYDKGISPSGENHPRSKLSNKDVEYIRQNYKPFDKEFGCPALSKKFNVTRSIICRIANGKNRKRG